MQPKFVALRKRSQIATANRMMFLWVASVSVVFGFALVAAIFLTQMLLFNERVLQEKDKTVAILKINNENVPKLEAEVRALDADLALMSAKAQSDDQAIQVILDALPSEANSLALGASLQNKLLAEIPGLSLISLQVDSVVGSDTYNVGSSINKALTISSGATSEITFRFSVSGDESALMTVLTKLERSIRTIHVTSLKIESQGSTRTLNIQAKAFYEPRRIVGLKDKTVK